MRIEICLHQREPPAGQVRVYADDETAPVAFVGWLGLLRALYDLLEADGLKPTIR